MYTYNLEVTKVNRKNSRNSTDFNIGSTGSYSTIRNCYINARDVVKTLGLHSEYYDWLRYAYGMLDKHIEDTYQLKRFISLEYSNEMFTFYVSLTVNEI